MRPGKLRGLCQAPECFGAAFRKVPAAHFLVYPGFGPRSEYESFSRTDAQAKPGNDFEDSAGGSIPKS